MKSVVIVGAGPAGVSASLYAVRAGMEVTVIANGIGALEKAHQIENYYGFPEGISGAELAERGKEGAERLGVSFVQGEVVDLGYNGRFVVSTPENQYEADAVILATGTSRSAPNIEGLKEKEGKGVSYCAVCDAFFYRGKNTAVLGSGEFALHEMQALLPVAASVTLLTNGQTPPDKLPENVSVIETPVKELGGESFLEHASFRDESRIALDGLFVAYGTAGSTALARKIGAVIKNGKIAVDASMHTSVPGLFAAGDCVGGMLQVAKAVYEGALAGSEAVKYLREKSK